ncbi:MAG: hypothetical protein HY056_12140 [Proteobacteria bacterium]|nr:hypothetical protein [Pseudomonadota bacterium]
MIPKSGNRLSGQRSCANDGPGPSRDLTNSDTALAIFNPLGLAILSSAIGQSPTDWLSYIWLWTSLLAGAVLILVGIGEYRIRGRGLARAAAKTG